MKDICREAMSRRMSNLCKNMSSKYGKPQANWRRGFLIVTTPYLTM